MEFRLRRAQGADRTVLARLAVRCFERPWSEAAVGTALDLATARAWLAEAPAVAGSDAASSLAGFLLARRIADQIEIDLVGVAPERRRRGLAAMLLKALIAEESRTGAVAAQLELSANNREAAALYAKLGFVVVGRRPRYYPDGSDALLLTRSLA